MGIAEEIAGMAGQTYPAWGKDLSGIDEFNVNECVRLLCGFNPIAVGGGYPSNDDYSLALRILESAMKRGELKPVRINPKGWPTLNAEAVRLWCPTVHRAWPIPPRPGLPTPVQHSANDASLLEKLRDAESRAVIAEARLKVHGEVIDATVAQRQQIADLQAKAARLEAEKKQAEADIASGKNRTTMLKLIGGMAMLQRVPIHGARNPGLTALINELASVGVSVSENTLRGLLKEAAQHIEPPKN